MKEFQEDEINDVDDGGQIVTMVTAKTKMMDETINNKTLTSSQLLSGGGDTDEMTRKRKYIIPHNHWFIRSWDYLIITLALYNSLTLPL